VLAVRVGLPVLAVTTSMLAVVALLTSARVAPTGLPRETQIGHRSAAAATDEARLFARRLQQHELSITLARTDVCA